MSRISLTILRKIRKVFPDLLWAALKHFLVLLVLLISVQIWHQLLTYPQLKINVVIAGVSYQLFVTDDFYFFFLCHLCEIFDIKSFVYFEK